MTKNILLIVGITLSLCASQLASQTNNAPVQITHSEIDNTRSPNEKFAIAWAPAAGEAITEAHLQNDGSYLSDSNAAINYLIECSSGNILALLRGSHFGDLAQYNHESIEVIWSPDSQTMIHSQQWKWHTEMVDLYQLDDVGRIIRSFRIGETLTTAAFAQMKKREMALAGRLDELAIRLGAFEFLEDGKIKGTISGEIPKSIEDDSFFEATVLLELSEESGGLEILSIDFGAAP